MTHRTGRRRSGGTQIREGPAGDAARARLAAQGRPVQPGPPTATTEQKFQLGGQNVTAEEFEVARREGRTVTRQQAEQRKEVIEEQFFQPREQLQTELETKIEEPPSLEPIPLTDLGARGGLAAPVGIGNFITGVLEDITGKQFGRTSNKELAQTKAGKALGLAIGAVGTATVIALGATAVGFLATKAASTTIVAKVGLSTGLLKTTIGAIFIAGGAASLFDIERGEITTAKNRLARITEQGERLLGATTSGLPIPFTFRQLQRMDNTVNEAEATIKQKGNINIKFRTSDEYLDLMEDIVDARLALVRRLEELEEIALTGTRPTNPEELILLAEDFP